MAQAVANAGDVAASRFGSIAGADGWTGDRGTAAGFGAASDRASFRRWLRCLESDPTVAEYGMGDAGLLEGREWGVCRRAVWRAVLGLSRFRRQRALVGDRTGGGSVCDAGDRGR